MVRLFRPRIAGAQDERAVVTMESVYAVNRKSKDNVVAAFLSFIHLNNFSSVGVGFRAYIGALITDGLKYSSIDTYSNYVVKAIHSLHLVHTFKDRLDISRLKHTIERAHADSEEEGACRAENVQVADILNRMLVDARCPTPVVEAFAMVCCTGSHPADVAKLRDTQVNVSADGLVVRFRLTKGRQKRGKRVTLRLRKFSKIFGRSIPTCLLTALGDADSRRGFRRWHTVSATAINRAIKRCNVGGPHVTTNSLRKNYIAHVCVLCDYDWTKVSQYTLHLNPAIVAAHYDALWSEQFGADVEEGI